ncbi:MAG: helix-turn-helix domain-containing protein [Ramlibacter sp.]
MSEEGLEQDAAASASQPVGATAGTLLREAREAAGLHVAALAVSLKVPVRKLEALEADRLDLLPDAVFVRALAASVCRTLKIDPAPVLARLPRTGAVRLTDSESGINAPFRSPSDGARPSWLDQLSRPVFLAVFALLLGALVLILLPGTHDEAVATAKSDPTPVSVPMVYQPPAESPPVSSNPTVPVVAAGGASASAAGTTVTKSISPSIMSTATASAARVVVVPAPAALAVPATGAVPANGLVVFKARGESWVQVTDAKGVVILRKLLLPGETAAASGATPLAVTVGSANATDVEVRGKPLDLAPYVRDNVSRFEVK